MKSKPHTIENINQVAIITAKMINIFNQKHFELFMKTPFLGINYSQLLLFPLSKLMLSTQTLFYSSSSFFEYSYAMNSWCN